MCIRPPSAWIVSSLTGRAAAFISSRKGRDLDRCRLPARGEGRDRGRLLEQAGIGCVEQLARGWRGRPRSARSSTSERLDVLRNWNSALSPCGRSGGARRTGSPPGGSILSTSAPRSAAILPASDVASRRQSGTSRVVHLDDGEARKRQGRRGHRAMIGASVASVNVGACYGRSHGGFHGTDRQSQGAAVRHFPRAVPPGRREPDAGHGARHGADRVDRRAGLRRGLDRRAPFRRLGDHRLAGSVHRRRRSSAPATSGWARA